jgi:hypothetical protein
VVIVIVFTSVRKRSHVSNCDALNKTSSAAHAVGSTDEAAARKH